MPKDPVNPYAPTERAVCAYCYGPVNSLGICVAKCLLDKPAPPTRDTDKTPKEAEWETLLRVLAEKRYRRWYACPVCEAPLDFRDGALICCRTNCPSRKDRP